MLLVSRPRVFTSTLAGGHRTCLMATVSLLPSEEDTGFTSLSSWGIFFSSSCHMSSPSSSQSCFDFVLYEPSPDRFKRHSDCRHQLRACWSVFVVLLFLFTRCSVTPDFASPPRMSHRLPQKHLTFSDEIMKRVTSGDCSHLFLLFITISF